MSNPTSFDERRTAQAAAFLLHRAGGRLHLIKLMKLLYLAERASLKTYGEPITGDSLVSMDYGPVLSVTLNHINGAAHSTEGGWDTWISDRADNVLALRDSSMVEDPTVDLMALSDSDVEMLDQVWAEFGKWDRWKLVKYTHDELPEWEDPHGSSLPITYERLFHELGYEEDQSAALISRLKAHSYMTDKTPV